MTKHVRAIGIAAVFLVGCAVGGASARFVVPPANAQQAAGIQRWEYFCFSHDYNEPEEVQQKANAAGTDGWEIATVAGGGAGTNDVWCFADRYSNRITCVRRRPPSRAPARFPRR